MPGTLSPIWNVGFVALGDLTELLREGIHTSPRSIPDSNTS